MSCPHTSKPNAGACSICLMPVVERIVRPPVDFDNLAALLRRSNDQVKAARGGHARAAKRKAPRVAFKAPRTLSAVHRERVAEAMSKVWAERTGISTAERATKIKALRTQGLTFRQIATAVPCGYRTVQRVLKESI